MRRARRLLLAALALAVMLVAAGFAVFAIRGSDEPPPPALSRPAATPSGTATQQDTWKVSSGAPTFVGYRVRERFVTFGVADAVGRTGDVTGTATVSKDRVTEATLETDMTTLRSDEGRRDDALRSRAIETDAFPRSTFELTEPFAIQRKAVTARGRLTLHGRTQPIAAKVQGQRLDDDTLELAGAAPIDFNAFDIVPPSVAGFVTVEDKGTLEFKLRLDVR